MTVNLRVKKKHIDDKAIDGSKIELLANEALVAQDPSQANTPVDLLKIDADGKVLSKGQEIAYKFQVDAEESARSSADLSLESRISSEESARQSAIYAAIADLAGTSPTVLSTLGQIATALSDGDAATGILNALEAENSQRVSADSSLTSRISSEESARSSADTSLTSRISSEESARSSADTSLTSRISSEESARASADYSIESRISALGSAFSKYYKSLTQMDVDNEYVDLPFTAVSNSIVAAIDRLMIHEGSDYDFTVATVNGVTRITFLNSLVGNGKEKLTAGDVLFVKYTKS
jgi:hypothetical protein